MFEAHNPLPESLEAMLRSALPKRSISLGGDTRRSFNKSERVDSPSGGATIGSSPSKWRRQEENIQCANRFEPMAAAVTDPRSPVTN